MLFSLHCETRSLRILENLHQKGQVMHVSLPTKEIQSEISGFSFRHPDPEFLCVSYIIIYQYPDFQGLECLETVSISTCPSPATALRKQRQWHGIMASVCTNCAELPPIFDSAR